jgi:hypothetical protein
LILVINAPEIAISRRSEISIRWAAISKLAQIRLHNAISSTFWQMWNIIQMQTRIDETGEVKWRIWFQNELKEVFVKMIIRIVTVIHWGKDSDTVLTQGIDDLREVFHVLSMAFPNVQRSHGWSNSPTVHYAVRIGRQIPP